MFYRYNTNTLRWERDKKRTKLVTLLFLFGFLGSFLIGRYYRITSLDQMEKELIVLNVEREKNSFTEDKLVEELKRLNVKFPHIVMAQSILETGRFKSNVFKENHNLFGMKQATVRINTASGTQNGHAYYENWLESVYDYAFYQCRYLNTIRTESEYFNYLSQSYAESDNYVMALKKVIKENNLRELF
jgi:uncharacterized FlgJ-related protein